MQFPPLAVIVAWPPANYDDPVTRGHALFVLMIFFSVLVVISCAGRFYSRIYIKHWFGWDDGFIIIALVFTIAMNAVVILANQRYGWDRHIWDVKPTLYQNAGIVAFTAKLLFVGASTFTRISLICFYYRLVKDSGITWFNKILHASMCFVVALGIAFTCIGIWLCIPVQAYWRFPPKWPYKCLDEGSTTLIIGIFNCIADLLCTLLPIPLVWRLKMPLKHRVGVCILLGLGFIVTVAGVLRTYFIWQSLISSWDVTWYSYPLWICATIEIDLAVICACAPAWKPILHQPVVLCATKLSSKFSRSGSLQPTPVASGSRTSKPTFSSSGTSRSIRSSLFKLHFLRNGVPPSAHDTQWSNHDRDEEYGMLHLHSSRGEKNNCDVTITSTSRDENLPSWPARVATEQGMRETRRPALEIMKQRTVDQEVEYISRAGSSNGSRHSPTESAPRTNELDR